MTALVLTALAPGAVASAQGLPATDIFLCHVSADPEGVPTIRSCNNITDRDGYDNQPAFTPDGRSLFYTSSRTLGSGDDAKTQTDIRRVDLADGEHSQVTDTPESEYSPTPLPSGPGFSVVRVEADGAQRLWRFDQDGENPKLVLSDIKRVGYHLWLGAERVVLFVLGEPHELRIVDIATQSTRLLMKSPGRAFHHVPGKDAFSFVDKSDEQAWSIRTAAASGKGSIETLAPTLKGSEDFVWLGDRLLMGKGTKLYIVEPTSKNAEWHEIADLEDAGLGDITRLAVSTDGDRLAVVANRAK